MKVDKLTLEQSDKLQVSAVKPMKTESKFLGSILPYKGHTLYEINPITGKCKFAEIESVNFKLIGGGIHKKVIYNHGCIYVSALNKKNALIKYFKMVGKQIEKMKKNDG